MFNKVHTSILNRHVRTIWENQKIKYIWKSSFSASQKNKYPQKLLNPQYYILPSLDLKTCIAAVISSVLNSNSCNCWTKGWLTNNSKINIAHGFSQNWRLTTHMFSFIPE